MSDPDLSPDKRLDEPGEPDPETTEAGPVAGALIKAAGADSMPFKNLQAPLPAAAEPPPSARWIAFGSIVTGGLLGGMIGYGSADLMLGGGAWPAVGALLGAILGAIGVGVVAGLALRAMNEWEPTRHPESETRASSGLVIRRTPAPKNGEPGTGADEAERGDGAGS